MSKDMPDWLELPVDTELLERANARFKELGTTTEDAVRLLLVRIVEHGDELLKKKAEGQPSIEIIADHCRSVITEIVRNAKQ